MSWRGIIIGAVAGFAWLAIIQVLLQSGTIAASTEVANWLTLGGLAVVWFIVVWWVNRTNNASGN